MGVPSLETHLRGGNIWALVPGGTPIWRGAPIPNYSIPPLCLPEGNELVSIYNVKVAGEKLCTSYRI